MSKRLTSPISILTRFASCLTLLFALVGGTSLVAQDDKADVSMKERLEKLEKLMEEKRVENHLPGMALAIVKDDQVIFSKGFGMANMEENKPVDENTGFAIGSSTKSFTSTLVAQLVAEGKMDWDDPVTKHYPEFKLDVDTGDEEITIRDLLSHQTGFTRMGILWASGSKSRAEVIAAAAQAEPYADFRETFLYNNVTYMTAGEAAAKVTGKSWDDLIKERFFEPLGMKNSSTTYAAAQENTNMATGYDWDSHKEEFYLKPQRNLDSIGPSGSINSNLVDMSKWIRMLLAGGEFEGEKIVDESEMENTRTGVIEMPTGGWYGMGWMISKWDGKRVVEHGGNIDGYSCQVTLLPEENIGYVLFANVTYTPLQQTSIATIFDTLLGDVKEAKGLAEFKPEELVGKYIANFGPFEDATMEVLIEDEKLALDVPRQQAYALKTPDEDGKWYFELTNTIAVSFNRDDEGKVKSVTMYQQGMEPEFLREGYTHKPDAPLNVLNELVGTYEDPDGDTNVEVSIKNGRVTITNPGRGTFDFLPPDEEGNWKMRANPDMFAIRFNKDEDGKTISLSRIDDEKEVEMKRAETSDSDPAVVPSTEELLAKMREATGSLPTDGFHAIKLTGQIKFVHQGAFGTSEMIFTNDSQFVVRNQLGEMANMVEAFGKEKAFTDSNLDRYDELSGEKLKAMELRHPLWHVDLLKENYTDISINGESTVDDKKTWTLVLNGEDVAERTLEVDQESGLILEETRSEFHDMLGEFPVTFTFGDFRKVGEVTVPFTMSTENPMVGKLTTQFESGEAVIELADDTFTRAADK